MGVFCLKGTPIARLKNFSGPFFFGMDELHCIGMGICQQVYKLLEGVYKGEFGGGCFMKSNTWWQRYQDALSQCRSSLPMSEFNGSFRYPRSKYSTRAVDWIDLVCYTIPALGLPSLPNDDAVAFRCLLRFIQYTRKKNLDILHMDND
ncbi:unnamed protein product [Absidia cylindrospora]